MRYVVVECDNCTNTAALGSQAIHWYSGTTGDFCSYQCLYDYTRKQWKGNSERSAEASA
jgi:hypothetical protein